MFKVILAVLIPLLILSCKTPKERAERLVKRANKIYPIDSLVSEKVDIDTLLKYDTVVKFKSDTVTLEIPVYETDNKTPLVYNKRILFDNERLTIRGTTNKKGGINLEIYLKEQHLRVKGEIRYQKQFITHRKLITVPVYKRGFFWWVGLCTSILVGGGSAIFLSIRIIKRYVK